jgi:hypothetical protein
VFLKTLRLLAMSNWVLESIVEVLLAAMVLIQGCSRSSVAEGLSILERERAWRMKSMAYLEMRCQTGSEKDSWPSLIDL